MQTPTRVPTRVPVQRNAASPRSVHPEDLDARDPNERVSRPARIGVVSFVNTLPLIDGLDVLEGLELRHTVPSRLIDLLLADEVDVALCSSIDYQHSPEPLLVIPAGMLGCDGPTLTVRLFSTRPIPQIERVYCDTDSHTSVVLMQILLRDRYGIDPAIVDYDAREQVAENRPIERPEAMLLIGDKVVLDSPSAEKYPHQLDLGEAWKEYTGLPFVFALWLAKHEPGPPGRAGRIAAAGAVLDRQRRYNQLRIDTIIHGRARTRDWPADLFAVYLKERINYALTDRHLAGLDLFFDRASALGLIARRRPVVLAGV